MLVLAAAVLVFVIALGAVFMSASTNQADDSCSVSLTLRAAAQQAGFEGSEVTCRTQTSTLTGSEQDVREDLVDAYNRCRKQFYTALNNEIVYEQQATYCHVCGVYTPQDLDFEQVEGLIEELDEQGFSGRSLRDSDSDNFSLQTGPTDAPLSVQEPISIVFFQDKTEEFSLLNHFASQEVTLGGAGLAAGAAALTVVSGGTALLVGAGLGASGYVTGHVLEDPDGSVYSGIVIRNYNAQALNQLGCTTTQSS